MLEEIALSISTLVFLLCNLVVNSMIPAVPNEPSEPIAPETAVEAIVTTDDFELAGIWNSGGRVFEFTRSGKLLYNGQAMSYELDGSTMLVKAEVDGTVRIYRLAYEPQAANVMKLNGVAMYRTSR